MAADHEEAHRFGIELLEHIANGKEVAQGLGHLLVVHVDETVVHPGLRKGLAGRTFALGDFIFVVGELQIRTAPMDIEALAQHFAAHGRALDVPAGTALAPGAVPFDFGRLGGLGALPEHEIQRVVLAVVHSHALAGLQLVERLARQPAVARELAHGKVHVAIARLIGQAAFLQPADHVQHLRHIVGGPGLEIRAFDAQGVRILVQRRNHAVGQLADGFAVFHGPTDDLVVDVGDVAHIGHAQAAGAQPALHDIKGDHGAGMPQMTQVIDGHAAHIHADVARLKRRKRFQCTRQRVVDTQTHGMSITGERKGVVCRRWQALGSHAARSVHPTQGAPGSVRADTPQLQLTAV
ncbi:hypothetical protein D3C78_1050620 [compost metagenome]